jgi:hypothetical protein
MGARRPPDGIARRALQTDFPEPFLATAETAATPVIPPTFLQESSPLLLCAFFIHVPLNGVLHQFAGAAQR